MPLPSTPSMFWLKFRVCFTLLVNGRHLGAYFSGIGVGIGNLSRVLVLLIPIVILLVVIIRKIYNTPNTDHGRDTIPLRVFKKISGITYQPLKRFIISYWYIDEEKQTQADTYIWVKMGPKDKEQLVYVDSVRYCNADEVPYPIEKTKRVIRQATEEEAAEADVLWDE